MRTIYLKSEAKANEVFLILSLKKTKYNPKTSSTRPWPISPNMTPKKKGKVTVVKMEGLIS